MSLVKAELIVHPVRLRIVEAVSRRRLTARQIAAQLPDGTHGHIGRERSSNTSRLLPPTFRHPVRHVLKEGNNRVGAIADLQNIPSNPVGKIRVVCW